MLLLFLPSTAALRVGVLSLHEPKLWSNSTCRENANSLSACNLRLYQLAAAANSGAHLLLFPEAYGLSGEVGGFEPLVSEGRSVPCSQSSESAPSQAAMSCAAREHNVTIVANFFVLLANGTRRIAGVAFEAGSGRVLATYFKHHLFPTEVLHGVRPGPFAPTSFVAEGRRWGLLICYEGLYAELFHDWSQIAALKAGGADAILWSIGSMMPDVAVSKSISRRFGGVVLAAEDSAAALARGAGAERIAANSSITLTLDGYDGKAAVDIFEVF